MISWARAWVAGATSWIETTSAARSASAESAKMDDKDVALAPVTPDFRSQPRRKQA
jgi:hypothetical protein